MHSYKCAQKVKRCVGDTSTRRNNVNICFQAQVFRFSMSWTRILPEGHDYKVNQAGIDYYNKHINALLDNGMQPMVSSCGSYQLVFETTRKTYCLLRVRFLTTFKQERGIWWCKRAARKTPRSMTRYTELLIRPVNK
jgi:hypothetical protein